MSEFINCPALYQHQHAEGCLTLPPPFPLGARITLPNYGGYVPIGFFQFWTDELEPALAELVRG